MKHYIRIIWHHMCGYMDYMWTQVQEVAKLMYTSTVLRYFYYWSIFTRAVKVSALIDAINLAAINALKYFNAINATLFTSGVRCPLTRNRRVPT